MSLFKQSFKPIYTYMGVRTLHSSLKSLKNIQPQKFSERNPFRVLFCGQNFPYALDLTKAELQSRKVTNVVCTSCPAEDLNEEIKKAHMVVPLMMRITEDHINSSDMRCILQYGVGIEGVDVEAATKRKVYVSNIPSVDSGNAQATAEHALYLILSALRNPKRAYNTFKQSRLGLPLSRQIFGKNVLILGLGSVGKELCNLLAPFSPKKIIAVKHTRIKPAMFDELKSNFSKAKIIFVHKSVSQTQLEVKTISEFDPIKDLREIDIVVISCTLTESTRGIVDAEFCSALKPGAALINIARGQIVENEAILDALTKEHVSFFASDVGCTLNGADDPLFSVSEPFPPTDPLAMHPNTLFTPHNGGIADVSYHNMARTVADTVERIRDGKSPLVCINGPFE